MAYTHTRTTRSSTTYHLDMASSPIRLAIDGYGGDAEASAGPDDAAGNLTPIRDQHFVEEGGRGRERGRGWGGGGGGGGVAVGGGEGEGDGWGPWGSAEAAQGAPGDVHRRRTWTRAMACRWAYGTARVTMASQRC